MNCFEGCDFLDLASFALGMGAMRVPRPAAGMMTTTFIAACKYTGGAPASSNEAAPLANIIGSSHNKPHLTAQPSERFGA